MNNLDNDLKDFFKSELDKVAPSKDVKSRILMNIEKETSKESLLSKLRNFLNREIEIPMTAVVFSILIICMLPVGFSIYYKEEISPTNKVQIEDFSNK